MNKFNRIANVAIETVKGAAKSKGHGAVLSIGLGLMGSGVLNTINAKAAVLYFTSRFDASNEVVKHIVEEGAKTKKVGLVLTAVGAVTTVGTLAHYYFTNKEELDKFYMTEQEREG